jgi:hypothetical protein
MESWINGNGAQSPFALRVVPRQHKTQHRRQIHRLPAQFDVFITADQGLPYQQNLTGRRMAILGLSTNKIILIAAAASLIQEALASIQPTEFRNLQIPK